MKNFLYSIVLVLFPVVLFAQTGGKGTVRGNIFNKETAQSVGFATVRINEANLGTISDVNGFFYYFRRACGQVYPLGCTHRLR